jgi:GNAT superfamily N-acetyltransferase
VTVALEIVRFEPSRLADHALVTGGDDAGGCHCAYFDVSEEEMGPRDSLWIARTPDQNRATTERTALAGRMQGLLAYLDGKPVGWCRFGRRTDFPRAELRFRRPAEEGVGCIACFSIVDAARKKGVAQALLARAVDEMKLMGLVAVEGYPRKDAHDPSENWRGPESLYARAGFKSVAEGGSFRVMRLELEA